MSLQLTMWIKGRQRSIVNILFRIIFPDLFSKKLQNEISDSYETHGSVVMVVRFYGEIVYNCKMKSLFLEKEINMFNTKRNYTNLRGQYIWIIKNKQFHIIKNRKRNLYHYFWYYNHIWRQRSRVLRAWSIKIYCTGSNPSSAKQSIIIYNNLRVIC